MNLDSNSFTKVLSTTITTNCKCMDTILCFQYLCRITYLYTIVASCLLGCISDPNTLSFESWEPILHVETTISSFNSFPDARSVIHLICKDRKESLSRCNRMKPLLYFNLCIDLDDDLIGHCIFSFTLQPH